MGKRKKYKQSIKNLYKEHKPLKLHLETVQNEDGHIIVTVLNNKGEPEFVAINSSLANAYDHIYKYFLIHDKKKAHEFIRTLKRIGRE